MQPTMKLRYVQRGWKSVNQSTSEYTTYSREPVYVLQQWWEGSSMGKTNLGWGEIAIGTVKGEWRDIPIEVEE